MGFHLMAAVSWGFVASSPGSCRIEMQTSPFGYTLGCQIGVVNVILGGLSG
jgi:hypothetical protein